MIKSLSMNKKSLLLVALFVVAGCNSGVRGPSTVPTAQSSPIPKAIASEPPHPTYDLGTIPQGEEALHEFVVRNESQKPIRFIQAPGVQLGCCMTVTVTPAVIPPGKIASIIIIYKTRLRPGPFNLAFNLYPDDPSFPSEFTITGTVTSSFVVDPIQINFEKPGTRQFVVQGDDLNVGYKLVQVTTNSPHLKVTEDKRTSSDQARVYNVQWDGTPLKKDVTTAVYVLTDSALLSWFPILIYAPEPEPSQGSSSNS